jgi:hypothetical protein
LRIAKYNRGFADPLDWDPRNAHVSHTSANTATIRELRTDIRSVKRKIEQQGQIRDHRPMGTGRSAHAAASVPKKSMRLPDYYDRMVKRQPKALSAAATRRFWEDERR